MTAMVIGVKANLILEAAFFALCLSAESDFCV